MELQEALRWARRMVPVTQRGTARLHTVQVVHRPQFPHDTPVERFEIPGEPALLSEMYTSDLEWWRWVRRPVTTGDGHTYVFHAYAFMDRGKMRSGITVGTPDPADDDPAEMPDFDGDLYNYRLMPDGKFYTRMPALDTPLNALFDIPDMITDPEFGDGW